MEWIPAGCVACLLLRLLLGFLLSAPTTGNEGSLAKRLASVLSILGSSERDPHVRLKASRALLAACPVLLLILSGPQEVLTLPV